MKAGRESTASLLRRLHEVRRPFSATGDEKLLLLERLSRARVAGARRLRQFHDDALFLLAFPDNAAVHEAARRAVAQFERRLSRLTPPRRRQFDDSGMPGSVSRHTFAYGIARWLAARHLRDVSLDWTAVTDRDAIDALLVRWMTPLESDAVEAGTLEPRRWLHIAASAAPSDLAWVLGQLAHWEAAERRADLYDRAGVPLRWRLRGRGTSVQEAPWHDEVRFRARLRASPRQARRVIASPLRAVALLRPADAETVIDAARDALTRRCREVHAISYANPDEVYVADLGEGCRLAVIGVEPSRRMGLEANYGYVLFANGVAIGYGGVSPLFYDANTGINIFEAFRGSEAGFLWVAMLRAFRTLFRTTRFIVNAYQFGEGNEEAISSGAFWFYYRLGFRPADRSVRELAAQESVRLLTRPRHRSDRATLRALASGDLHLTMPDFRSGLTFEEKWLGRLADVVTHRIAASRRTSRRQALHRMAGTVAGQLGVRVDSRLRPDEQHAFSAMAPIASVIPDLDHWAARDRRALAALMWAKGAPRERDYVLRCQDHRRFIRALRAVVAQPRQS